LKQIKVWILCIWHLHMGFKFWFVMEVQLAMCMMCILCIDYIYIVHVCQIVCLLRLTHVCMNMYHLLPLIIIIQLFNVVIRRIGRRECIIRFWIWIWMWWVHTSCLIFTLYFSSITYQQSLHLIDAPFIYSLIHSFL
jgi:hypothetical protein